MLTESPSTADSYTKGMSTWQEEDDLVLNRLRAWHLQIMKPYLGKRILEVGAGNGNFAKLLSAAHKYEKYVALEPSSHFFAGLKKTQEQLRSIEIANCSLKELGPDLAGSFDTVFSVHVMEHIEDDLDFLRRCYDLVAPGGRVIVLVPALQFLYSKMDRRIGHHRRYDRKQIAALAKKLSAKLILNRYDNLIGVPGWLWVCKIRGIDYNSNESKKTLISYFSLFLNYFLPAMSRIEKILPPPIGLNLTAVFQKPESGR